MIAVLLLLLCVISLVRCPATSECVPVLENSAVIDLPVEGDSQPIKIMGRCIEPCEARCSTDPEIVQCGTDGRTYSNPCYRMCARNNIGVSSISGNSWTSCFSGVLYMPFAL